ncbi:MAG: hypothetical protein Kow0042_11230 [Calditrichia bacterium]
MVELSIDGFFKTFRDCLSPGNLSETYVCLSQTHTLLMIVLLEAEEEDSASEYDAFILPITQVDSRLNRVFSIINS